MTQGAEVDCVACASIGSAAAGFQVHRTTSLTVDAVELRLKAEIQAAGFWVLHQIDTQKLLARDGYRILPARQILFFHPRFMAPIVRADPAAIIEAPLKFAILELPGVETQIRWNSPAISFSRYLNPTLCELGNELAAHCDQICAKALEN